MERGKMANVLYENGFPIYALVNGQMVEVQEVRHGRWIDVEPAPHNLFYATCSVCGDRQTIEVANYCPMCGASMGRKSKCVECKGGYCEDECGAKMDEVGE